MDSVLYVWSDSESKEEEDEVIAGLNYNYHVAQVIRDGLLHSTLLCDYRYIPREFRMMATAYVADINRDNTVYIYTQ